MSPAIPNTRLLHTGVERLQQHTVLKTLHGNVPMHATSALLAVQHGSGPVHAKARRHAVRPQHASTHRAWLSSGFHLYAQTFSNRRRVSWLGFLSASTARRKCVDARCASIQARNIICYITGAQRETVPRASPVFCADSTIPASCPSSLLTRLTLLHASSDSFLARQMHEQCPGACATQFVVEPTPATTLFANIYNRRRSEEWTRVCRPLLQRLQCSQRECGGLWVQWRAG
eukprot:366398-Chlamydomonas_euryale.AAC.6